MRTGIETRRTLTRALCLMVLALLWAGPAAAQHLGGYTNMSRDPGHGTQIEYVAGTGKAYLWYPGNTRILQGQWKLEDGNMCFDYGPNTFNPVTGNHGGWECEPVDAYQSHIVERQRGDILGLGGRRAVPFSLDRGPTTLAQLIARVASGGRPAAVPTPQTCETIIANAERSKADMARAGGTYFHGIFMGKPCVTVDYARAFDLIRRSGESVQPFLDILQARAEAGNPKAIRALELLDR